MHLLRHRLLDVKCQLLIRGEKVNCVHWLCPDMPMLGICHLNELMGFNASDIGTWFLHPSRAMLPPPPSLSLLMRYYPKPAASAVLSTEHFMLNQRRMVDIVSLGVNMIFNYTFVWKKCILKGTYFSVLPLPWSNMFSLAALVLSVYLVRQSNHLIMLFPAMLMRSI